MNKRALIIGITGMVGSHLADYLLANQTGMFMECADGAPLNFDIDKMIEKNASSPSSRTDI